MILSQSKKFVKDSKKVKMNDKHFTKFINFLALLSNSKSLPKEAKDHSLRGDWFDFREFHISGDLLVIYKLEDKSIKLIRIGTHSQLFG